LGRIPAQSGLGLFFQQKGFDFRLFGADNTENTGGPGGKNLDFQFIPGNLEFPAGDFNGLFDRFPSTSSTAIGTPCSLNQFTYLLI